MADKVEQLENAGGISEDMMLKVIALKNKLEDSSVLGKVKDGESQTSLNRHIPGSQDVRKQDNNGNVLSYEENCPFDTICDFLQALVTKKYKKALRICKIILSFEPGNEIANEFLHVLEEMVTVNDDTRDGGASETTQLGRFYGSGDGRGDDSIEVKNAGDGDSSGDDEDSSDDSISSGDSSDEHSGDSTSSSSTDTESSDEGSSSSSPSEDEADSQDPLEKICNSLNEESSSSSSGEEDEDGESETSSSGSSLSSHDSAGDSEEDDYHQDTSAQLDTEISALIEHFQGTYGSLDVQDTFDMVSSLDLEEDEEEEDTNKLSSGGGVGGGKRLELNEGESRESSKNSAVEVAEEERE